MMQPLTQARVCYLEQFGEDEILDLVASGMFLDEIVARIDPRNTAGLTRPLVSKWLSGKLKRNVSLSDGTAPETPEQAKKRGEKYAAAKKLWADSIVETQAKKLFDESNDKMANLRKAQSEFALKLAGIHNHKYIPPPSSVIGVQVNVAAGEKHLNALRRRIVKDRNTPALPAGLRPATESADVQDAEIIQEGE
jgi:hypothetical protein